MKRALNGLVMGGLFLLSAPSMAALSLVNYNGFEIRQSGNTWTISHEPPSSTALRGGTVLRNAGVSTSERALVANHRIPVGKGIPIDVVAKIPAGVLARAVVSAGKIATPIGAVVTAAELLNYFKDSGIINLRNTADGLVADGKQGEEVNTPISDGHEYMAWDIWTPDPEAACNDRLGQMGSGASLFEVQRSAGGTPRSCVYIFPNGSKATAPLYQRGASSCPAGWYVVGNKCTLDSPSKELTEQEIIDKMALNSGWPTSAAIAAQRAISLGVPIQTETPVVTGPSSVPGEKTTTNESVNLNPGTNTPAAPGSSSNTQPGTKTTTKTSSTNVNYSGSNVTTNTTTTTVTNITNNVTNITTTETTTETKEDDEKPEDPPTDTPLGDIPDLYKQKYPGGIGGVLNTKFAELKATPLFNLPSLLMPSLPNSGSCPSWQIDLGLAGWANMGTHTVQAPCMVWDFGKVIIIISALILARRLIFGG